MIRFVLFPTRFGNFLIFKIEVTDQPNHGVHYRIGRNIPSHTKSYIPSAFATSDLYQSFDDAKLAAELKSSSLKNDLINKAEYKLKNLEQKLQKLRNHTPKIRVINTVK